MYSQSQIRPGERLAALEASQLQVHQLVKHRAVVHAGVKLSVLTTRIHRGRQVIEQGVVEGSSDESLVEHARVHAREAGADAVAVIGPPYFKLDAREQRAHLIAAARACAPLPFYVYQFAATAGYAFDPSMLARLREEADNVTGMKVSDTPWTAFERYLLDGFDIFVGPEALIHRGREAGAVGAVSALASAFPEEVAAVVREPTEEGAAGLAALRATLESFPRHAALKRVAAWKGVPLRPDVRPPLRDLDETEVAELEAWLAAGSS